MGAAPLADGLQNLKPGPMLGRLETHTFRRAMIHRDEDGYLPLLARVCRRHIGPPHRIDIRRDDRPIMDFWTMRMPLTGGGQ
jgi:hypothetical protein